MPTFGNFLDTVTDKLKAMSIPLDDDTTYRVARFLYNGSRCLEDDALSMALIAQGVNPAGCGLTPFPTIEWWEGHYSLADVLLEIRKRPGVTLVRRISGDMFVEQFAKRFDNEDLTPGQLLRLLIDSLPKGEAAEILSHAEVHGGAIAG